MGLKSKAQLEAALATTFPDNTLGTITPAALRSFLGDMLDTLALDPLLSRFDLLFRAATFDGEDGDRWLNEGTAGHDYDAVAADSGDNPTTDDPPHYVTSPSPGFEITQDGEEYYFVPNGPGIEPGTSSFTAFARFYTASGSGSFYNVMSKILTPPEIGAGGTGWQILSGTALGTATLAIASGGGSSPGTDPAFASGAVFAAGEHLLVMRVNQSTNDFDLFIDGVKTTGTVAGVADVTADHELIFGRGATQTNRAYGLIMEALTDDEVARLGDLFPIA